jgi:hypothetical protein
VERIIKKGKRRKRKGKEGREERKRKGERKGKEKEGEKEGLRLSPVRLLVEAIFTLLFAARRQL